jgi:hypothetical protein
MTYAHASLFIDPLRDGWAASRAAPGTRRRAGPAQSVVVARPLQHRENEREAGSRAMVEEMKKLGVDVTDIEVPGGSHTDVVVPNLPKAFKFLAARKRTAAASQ